MSEGLTTISDVIESVPVPIAVVIGQELSDEDLQSASEKAHIIEFRADLYDSTDEGYLSYEAERLSEHKPVLLTVRSDNQGGQFTGSEDERLALIDTLMEQASGVDIELFTATNKEIIEKAHSLGRTAILSVHDFVGTIPSFLDEWLNRAKEIGADYYKLATALTYLHELQDLALFTLNNRDEDIITVGMDNYGPLSRIVLPSLGSRLVYGFPNETDPIVSGQLSVPELAASRDKLFLRK